MVELEGTSGAGRGVGPTPAARLLKRQLRTSREVAGIGRGGRRKFRLAKKATSKMGQPCYNL